MLAGCLFCQLAQGEIPSYRLYEDEVHIVLLDTYPLTYGHLLVCTKAHIGNLYDLDEEPLLQIMLLVKKFSLVIKDLLKPLQVVMMTHNIVNNHLHIHLVPAYSQYDIFSEEATSQKKPATEEELADLLRRYRDYEDERSR